MSSHWEWEKEIVAKHNEEKPFAPENGQPLQFKPGDLVIFTNDYGVSFKHAVTGYYLPGSIDSMYATGYRYMLDGEAPWMPARERSLSSRPEEVEARPEWGTF